MFGRIDLVHARAEDGDRASASLERGGMGDRVHAARQPRDDCDSLSRQERGQVFGDLPPVGRDAPRPDDGNRVMVVETDLAARVEDGRRLFDLFQARRIEFVVPRQDGDALLVDLVPDFFEINLCAQVDG